MLQLWVFAGSGYCEWFYSTQRERERERERELSRRRCAFQLPSLQIDSAKNRVDPSFEQFFYIHFPSRNRRAKTILTDLQSRANLIVALRLYDKKKKKKRKNVKNRENEIFRIERRRKGKRIITDCYYVWLLLSNLPVLAKYSKTLFMWTKF